MARLARLGAILPGMYPDEDFLYDPLARSVSAPRLAGGTCALVQRLMGLCTGRIASQRAESLLRGRFEQLCTKV